MAAMSDLATPAAAVAAGYQKIQIDRGASVHPRFTTILEKWLLNEPGKKGFMHRSTGVDDTSFANSDNAALANLNSFRTFRYGKGATTNNGHLPANAAWNQLVD